MFHFLRTRPVFVFTLLLGAAVSLVSCRMAEKEMYEGTWVVTEATLPGVTAMTQTEADAWLGKSFSYEAERAQLAQTFCLAPTYTRETLESGAFETVYRIRRDKLAFIQGDITRIQLQCDDRSLMPGQTLLMQEGIVTYLIWDGVFFKLEKSKNDTAPTAVPS